MEKFAIRCQKSSFKTKELKISWIFGIFIMGEVFV